MVRTEAYQRVRETADPDDYTSMFAIWSGTSFAAPLFGGRLAAAMASELPAPSDTETAANAISRCWKAVSGLTDLTP